MPNRIIKESIRTSKSVNSLTDFQFRLWINLITFVDDYGRGPADPDLIKGFVFPRRKSVTEVQIQKALLDLANIGMIRLYEADGEPYFYFPNWSSHQRIQTKKSKYPEPTDSTVILSDDGDGTVIPTEFTADHGDSTVTHRESTVNHREPPPESESNTNTNTNTNPNPIFCAESEADSTQIAATLLLNDGTEHPVTMEQCHQWADLYPAVDVIRQLKLMKQWCEQNPSKRKTKKGINRFITGWLDREQNRYHPTQVRNNPSGGTPFKELLEQGLGEPQPWI